MKIEVRKKGKVVILDMSGKLDMGTGDVVLRDTFKELLERDERLFVFNMKDVFWMDSAGLGELIACNKRARERGGIIRLVLSPKAHEVLTISRVIVVFDIYDDVESAIASFV